MQDFSYVNTGKELYQDCFFHCCRKLCHKRIYLLMEVVTTGADTVQSIPCHNDFWHADSERNSGGAEVGDHLLEMLSSFRGLQSNAGEKKAFMWWTKPWILAVSEEPCLPALSKGCPRTGILQVKAQGCILVRQHHLITALAPLLAGCFGSIRRFLEGPLGT